MPIPQKKGKKEVIIMEYTKHGEAIKKTIEEGLLKGKEVKELKYY